MIGSVKSLQQNVKVAILGSGISGSIAANILNSQKNIDCSVFEVGRGAGGRTSTRRMTHEQHNLYFDHGCQYISPKTEQFTLLLESWPFVKKWKANIYSYSISNSDSDSDSNTNFINTLETKKKDIWVGYPHMNSIAKGLLDGIELNTESRANAAYDDQRKKWILSKDKTNEHLGEYDWLIVTDQLSAQKYRQDIGDGDSNNKKNKKNNSNISASTQEIVGDYRKVMQKTGNMSSLVLMVAFENKLKFDFDNENINIDVDKNDADVDAIRFNSHDVLGWAVREESKPGRERNDELECWTIQSTPEAAADLIKKINKRGMNFEKSRAATRVEAHDMLMNSFKEVLTNLGVNIPPILASSGHRWAAAFPKTNSQSIGEKCYINVQGQFAACGDTFSQQERIGRVEAAALSGKSAAEAVIASIESQLKSGLESEL